jgi:hypothetical protein
MRVKEGLAIARTARTRGRHGFGSVARSAGRRRLWCLFACCPNHPLTFPG